MKEHRGLVMECSVLLEESIGITLAIALGLDVKESKALGSSQGSLSFIQKITLLMDMKSVSKDEKEKLKLFSEIRNKFAHLARIETIEDCLNDDVSVSNKIYNYYEEESKKCRTSESDQRVFLALLLECKEFSIRNNVIHPDLKVQ